MEKLFHFSIGFAKQVNQHVATSQKWWMKWWISQHTQHTHSKLFDGCYQSAIKNGWM